MANYTALYHSTFHDKKFKKLHVEAKLLFFYLLANNNINLTGIFDIDVDVAQILTGCKRSFEENMKELSDAGMVKWDTESSKVWIVNRFKWLVVRNSKVIAGAINELQNIDHPFKDVFIKKYNESLAPYLCKLPEHESKPSELLSAEQLQYLVKLYHTKQALKRFLLNTNCCTEHDVDEAIKKHLPHLQ